MWYSVESIFQCIVEGSPEEYQTEEHSIYLINVGADESPEEKAQIVGKNMEHQYKNEDGENVSWILKEISEIQDICEEELYDGVEVFYRWNQVANKSQ